MPITQNTILPLEYGSFSIAYHKSETGSCISISAGNLNSGLPIVRLHSSCVFGEALHSLVCECAKQLTSTLQLIAASDGGVVVYEYAEGRGVGLENKIQAMDIQRTKKVDTVEAFELMGFTPDLRSYTTSINALRDLDVSPTIRLASQNPHKRIALEKAGFKIIELLHPEIEVTEYNKPELLTKKHKLGYGIESV
jgi:GTP cyclohydrolase II